MTNAELDARLRKVEALTQDFSSVVEPKGGSHVGQRWFNPATEVLSAWNGRQYVPAYGKSIVQTIEGAMSLIEQTEDELLLMVKKDEVISQINLSTEGIRISATKIYIDGTTTFAAGYNPATVQANLTALQGSLGGLAYDNLVGLAKLDNTIIAGGYIQTSLINTTAISIGSFSGNLDNVADGSTYRRTTLNEKTGAARGYNALNGSDRYKKWLDAGDITESRSTAGYTGVFIDSTGLRGYKAGINTFYVSAATGDAFFRGNIYAESGTFTGSITSSATITGGSFRTSTSSNAIIIESDYLYFGNFSYLTSGGLFGATGIRCFGDFNVVNDLYVQGYIEQTLKLGTLSNADLELTTADNRIIGKDGTDGQIYFSASRWYITRPVTMLSTLEIDTQLNITGTTTPQILFDGTALRKQGADLYWGATKLN